jgi:hypothetical protein
MIEFMKFNEEPGSINNLSRGGFLALLPALLLTACSGITININQEQKPEQSRIPQADLNELNEALKIIADEFAKAELPELNPTDKIIFNPAVFPFFNEVIKVGELPGVEITTKSSWQPLVSELEDSIRRTNDLMIGTPFQLYLIKNETNPLSSFLKIYLNIYTSTGPAVKLELMYIIFDADAILKQLAIITNTKHSYWFLKNDEKDGKFYRQDFYDNEG